jgi:predicted phage tail protein
MLKGVFNKITAYIGVATGILGSVAVVGSWFTSALGIATILASVLTMVWVFLVGARLIRFR